MSLGKSTGVIAMGMTAVVIRTGVKIPLNMMTIIIMTVGKMTPNINKYKCPAKCIN
jgi:hypothetical protein